MYRIAFAHHHRTGDTWCISPMYDFAHPLSDAIEGITHSLCSFEFEDHRPLYNWFIEQVGLFPNPPRQIEFSRMEITNVVTSKRKLRALVEDGVVDGWDDPRMPTLAGTSQAGVHAGIHQELYHQHGGVESERGYHRLFLPGILHPGGPQNGQ